MAASPSGEAVAKCGAARLIALDWGSTRLRGWLLDDDGLVLGERSSDDGASRITGGIAAFHDALRSLAGDWLAQTRQVLACGMVGSAHGWREAPYVRCPATLRDLHRHLVTADAGSGVTVKIVPGLIDDPEGGTPDVMRGEETQLVGLLALRPDLADSCTVLMPGTHSKWVQLARGEVRAFRTRMTGELYALLRKHSVLARLMPQDDRGHFESDAFDAGVAAAGRSRDGDLAGQLFAVRTLGLTGRWPADALPDYLSGLLVGHELAAGLAARQAALAVVGDSALCERYVRALRAFGTEPACVHSNTACVGLWRIALSAGTISP
jgi:2-dehydro-3-deoxygalactonokinase